MMREFSAGALVLRYMQKQWWVAVIEPGREGEPEDRKNVVALPKGNVDAGEKPAETALREVHEETGLKATLIAKLGDIKYVYVRKWAGNEKAFKIVSFFLTKYQSGQIDNVTRPCGMKSAAPTGCRLPRLPANSATTANARWRKKRWRTLNPT